MANHAVHTLIFLGFAFLGLNSFSHVAAHVVAGHAAGSFGYKDDNGPEKWPETFAECGGKLQSPINIVEHNVKGTHYPELQFHQFENHHLTRIENNGHTVKFQLNQSEEVYITGGPLLEHTYEFEQLHFHWGKHDKEGSEGQINNHSFAMELHAVFYNTAYKTFSNAVNHPDGLTVLGYFFEASNESNPVFEPIMRSLDEIKKANTEIPLSEPLKLNELLLPKQIDLQRYFTYKGSLTTPPCSEVVTWIPFRDPLHLSHDQLAIFREIEDSDGDKLVQNFRPVQPVANREIFMNLGLDEEEKPDTDAEPGPKLELEPETKAETIEQTEEPVKAEDPKSEVDNDISDTFKEEPDEDPDKVTTEEIEELMEERMAGDGSSNVEMFINIFVTFCTLCTIFIMR